MNFKGHQKSGSGSAQKMHERRAEYEKEARKKPSSWELELFGNGRRSKVLGGLELRA